MDYVFTCDLFLSFDFPV